MHHVNISAVHWENGFPMELQFSEAKFFYQSGDGHKKNTKQTATTTKKHFCGVWLLPGYCGNVSTGFQMARAFGMCLNFQSMGRPPLLHPWWAPLRKGVPSDWLAALEEKGSQIRRWIHLASYCCTWGMWCWECKVAFTCYLNSYILGAYALSKKFCISNDKIQPFTVTSRILCTNSNVSANLHGNGS